MAISPDPGWLARSALFGGLSENSCCQFAQRMLCIELKPGDVLYQEGDSASSLFVLAEGKLEICKQHNGRQVVMGELKAGEFFGDMSFIDMQPRSMTVRASERAVAWQLDYSVLRDVYASELKCYTLVVMNIAREMSRRLRRADRARVIDRMSAQLFERATGARRAFGDVISRIGLRSIGSPAASNPYSLNRSRAANS